MSYGCRCVDGQKEPRIEDGREFCSGCGEMTAAEWERTLTPKRNPYPNHPAPPKRRGMSAASTAMLLGAVALGGGSAGPVRESRAEREAHKASRPGGDERMAKAEAKRQRKAARRARGSLK